MTGFNKNIRLVVPLRTLVFGAPFLFTATPADNERLRTQNCALFYIFVDNSSGGAQLTVAGRNKVISGTESFLIATNSHLLGDGNTLAASTGFGLSDDGDYTQSGGNRGTRLHAGYELEFTCGVGGQLDFKAEVHYGRESGG